MRLAVVGTEKARVEIFGAQRVGVPHLTREIVMREVYARDTGFQRFAPYLDRLPVGNTGAAVGVQAQVSGVALGFAFPCQQTASIQINALVIPAPAFVAQGERLNAEQCRYIGQQCLERIAGIQPQRAGEPVDDRGIGRRGGVRQGVLHQDGAVVVTGYHGNAFADRGAVSQI